MKEFIVICVINLFYLFLSYKIHLKLKCINWILFIFFSISYLVITYFYFEFWNYLHGFLGLNGIFIELGHGNLILIINMLACFILAFINILLAAFKIDFLKYFKHENHK